MAAVHLTHNVRKKHSSYGDKDDLAWMQSTKNQEILSKWVAVKDTVLKTHFTKQNIAENYPRSYPPR